MADAVPSIITCSIPTSASISNCMCSNELEILNANGLQFGSLFFDYPSIRDASSHPNRLTPDFLPTWDG